MANIVKLTGPGNAEFEVDLDLAHESVLQRIEAGELTTSNLTAAEKKAAAKTDAE